MSKSAIFCSRIFQTTSEYKVFQIKNFSIDKKWDQSISGAGNIYLAYTKMKINCYPAVYCLIKRLILIAFKLSLL